MSISDLRKDLLDAAEYLRSATAEYESDPAMLASCADAIDRALTERAGLYEALKVAERHVQTAYARNPQFDAFRNDLAMVRAALAKAEGRF